MVRDIKFFPLLTQMLTRQKMLGSLLEFLTKFISKTF